MSLLVHQLTPHFTLSEALHNSGFRSPPGQVSFDGVYLTRDQYVANLQRHAHNLETLRAQVNALRGHHHLPPTGINFVSWVRSPGHNHEVGGALLSRHQYWDATDISLEEIQRLCPWPHGHSDFDHLCDLVFAHGGFGTYPGGNRHVDSRGYRARWSDWTPGR